MKVIDLLNKIANGEEVPEKIRVYYRVFENYLNHNAYLNTEDEENYKYLTDLPRLYDDDRDWLNEEIEIIEEDKKIKKLDKAKYIGTDLSIQDDMFDKINEIIDCINKEK